jgi:hypothetical protein
VRMGATLGAMPPPPYPPVTPEVLQVFADWVDAGLPSGGLECDGGLVLPDAGPVEVDGGSYTCASGYLWNTLVDPNDTTMYPGRACIGCHTALQLDYQQFGYAGTVMASASESDDCDSAPPGDGGFVQIVEPDGGVLALEVYSTGNFLSREPFAGPYTAQVLAHGNVVQSQTPHTSGDCNACHGTDTTQGSGGRLVFP